MIMTIDELLERMDMTDAETLPSIEERKNMERRLKALETKIRAITNNKFHWVGVQTEGYMDIDAMTKKITGPSFGPMFQPGDNIDIFQDEPSNGRLRPQVQNELGVFTIDEVGPHHITVKEPIRSMKIYGVAIMVNYPEDIKDGITNLFKYDQRMGSKIGIKSESISRYSVTYYDTNSQGSASLEGYPASLWDFIQKYQKLRWS